MRSRRIMAKKMATNTNHTCEMSGSSQLKILIKLLLIQHIKKQGTVSIVFFATQIHTAVIRFSLQGYLL